MPNCAKCQNGTFVQGPCSLTLVWHFLQGAAPSHSGLAFCAGAVASALIWHFSARAALSHSVLAFVCSCRASRLRFGICVQGPRICSRLASLRRGRASWLCFSTFAQGPRIHPCAGASSVLPPLLPSPNQRGNLKTFVDRNSAQRKSKTC